MVAIWAEPKPMAAAARQANAALATRIGRASRAAAMAPSRIAAAGQCGGSKRSAW